jgi:hypothetical protein
VNQVLTSRAGVITITTRATALQRPTTLPRHTAVAAGGSRAVTRATYWRRRFVVVALAVALVLVMAQAGAALGGSLAAPERRPAGAVSTAVASGARSTGSRNTGSRNTVVRPGDSLWSVAARLAPGTDPRPVVDALADARHGTVLVPGETVEWDG